RTSCGSGLYPEPESDPELGPIRADEPDLRPQLQVPRQQPEPDRGVSANGIAAGEDEPGPSHSFEVDPGKVQAKEHVERDASAGGRGGDEPTEAGAHRYPPAQSRFHAQAQREDARTAIQQGIGAQPQ